MCALAALMVMGLSGTAMAKSWRGSYTDKWQEDKWSDDGKPPTNAEVACIGFIAFGGLFPVVNVEGETNVAQSLCFRDNTDENIDVFIKNGGKLTLGAPGTVAKIYGSNNPDDGPGKWRIDTARTGILTFNSRSNNVQINVFKQATLSLGAVDVPKMMDADGGVYQTGCVTLIGRIKALGGHEPWRLRDSRLTVEWAEYLDLPAPDVLKL